MPRSAPPLSPAGLLALQRTAGNQAVARLVRGAAGARALQRMPVEGADPASDRFWPELALSAETQLTAWLENDFNLAIDQFESDLSHAEAEDGAGQFLLDTFVTLIAFLPDAGEIIVGVLSIAKGIYDQLPVDSPIDLATFLEQARKNKLHQAKAVVNHDHEVFRTLSDAQARENAGETDLGARQAAAAQLSQAIAALPLFDTIRQTLTFDWVKSSEDGWDFDSAAGSISFTADIAEESGSYGLISPRIDDASRPEGVIQALKGAYGANTPLELLPIETTAHACFGPSGRRATFVNPRAASAAPRTAPAWTFLAGDETAIESWERQRPALTVADLVP